MIACLTCTRDRPEALAQCEKYVRRMIGAPKWVVSTDGEAPSGVHPEVMLVNPPQPSGAQSMTYNLVKGLEWAIDNGIEALAIVEDDDWYGQSHFISDPLDTHGIRTQPMRYYRPGRGVATSQVLTPLASWIVPRKAFDALMATAAMCHSKNTHRVDAMFLREHAMSMTVRPWPVTWVGIKGYWDGPEGLGLGATMDYDRSGELWVSSIMGTDVQVYRERRVIAK